MLWYMAQPASKKQSVSKIKIGFGRQFMYNYPQSNLLSFSVRLCKFCNLVITRMRYLLFLIILLSAQCVFAQTKLPVIKATSLKVAINDGGYLDKNAWNLSPKTRPDVYTADRSRKAKWVTFYTDIDSIRIKVKPGTRYNFIILLNGRDSCYTQVASAIQPETVTRNKAATHDTIPFVLTPSDAIAVKTIINHKDTLLLHFDVGSFYFSLTRDALAKKLPGQKVTTLQMGSITWNDPDISPTQVTATGMDGKFGWQLFDGKMVEIDYDKGLLIIHSELPDGLAGYKKSKLNFVRSFVCTYGDFKIGSNTYRGNFLMDTGSGQALIVDSTWAARVNLPKDLKLIRSSSLRDPRGVKYETRVVLAPQFKLSDFGLKDVPVYLLGSQNPTRLELNYLGNDLLKRFHIILDFKHDNLYLKPSGLMGAAYKEHS
jgi:hypothetical protein